MCGICGVIGPEPAARTDRVAFMAQALSHRGPDDAGVWRGAFTAGRTNWGVGFGHTRLSILDLSSQGHQPMVSEDSRTVIVYNGEIYNHRQLRAVLERQGYRFQSRCDTEVVLHAYRAWGVAAFPRLEGMFAFAIWDDVHRRVVLVRDRLGIKPLHYRLIDGILTFGSELSALRAHPSFRPEISLGGLETYLRYGWTTGRETIYRDTYRVLPGHYIVWEDGVIDSRRYWSVTDHAPSDDGEPFPLAVERLDRLLGDVVEQHLISDVPLGAFLSGGIDSSTVVALMQERATRPVRTFSIGFRDPAYDEARHARAVATHLRTAHTELYVDTAQAREVARELPTLYDEPHSDPSAVPTVLLSRMTRESVTVALSGDGGDELFGGYRRYGRLRQLLPLLRLPAPLRTALFRGSSLLGSSSIRNGLQKVSTARDEAELAESFHVNFDDELLRQACHRAGSRLPSVFCEVFRDAPGNSSLRKAMYAEARTYLTDDVLVKVDRASMAVGLEARVPLLDHRIVEFAFGLPLRILRQGGQTKAPLRAVLDRRVPKRLIERPKQGFGFPIRAVLGTELEDWTRKYLAPSRIAEEGILDPDAVDRMVTETRRTGPQAEWQLWRLLCFERWLARTHLGETDS